MNRLGTTVVVATHNDALVARHPARALRLEHGRLVGDGRCACRGRSRICVRSACARRGFDDLGLRRALSDRLLPVLVAAMAFLAALALAGAVAAASLAAHWQEGAAAALTVQVPHPGEPRLRARRHPAAIASLGAAARIAPASRARAPLPADGIGRLAAALARHARPARSSLPLPAVIQVRLAGPGGRSRRAARRALAAVAPGTHRGKPWRLDAAADRAGAQPAGLRRARAAAGGAGGGGGDRGGDARRARGAARRDRDRAWARRHRRLHRRALRRPRPLLASIGRRDRGRGLAAGAAGARPASRPRSRAPEAAGPGSWPRPGATCPGSCGSRVPALPLAAAAIGWLTAQGTVRAWLRRLA